jgi:hypothetical protein
MNRIATLSAIIALSVLSISEIAYAQGAEMNWPANIDKTVTDFKGDKVSVVQVSTLAEANQTRMWVEKATPEQRKALLTAIEGNKALADQLKSQNIEMENIAGAEQAADGALIVYVR